MDKTFDFKSAEERIYKKWQDGQYFTARINPDKKPYTTIMPPPNVTARLHAGHAFEDTIQDAIARYKRMQGYEVLYLPGADHAAIATEVKIIEELKKQGIDKSDLTREEFMQHVDSWYKKYTAEIKDQLKCMGLSCDWSRFSFTMDESCAKAVNHVFKSLYDKGLIYKGERMVNMCPGCRSALSDAEVEYKEEKRTMYYVRYSDEVVVATVRPETIYGDVAVAVNPKDKRYAKLVGTMVTNPLTGTKIPVIVDDYVDMKFGTGALKITPAHDPADFQIGLRHKLPIIKAEDLSEDARKRAVETLEQKGLLVKQTSHTSNIGKCYRCNAIVEPTISKQWFVAMSELAKPAIRALETGELKILPSKFEKTYLHWLNNIQDWCISRQLTSGHRVPIQGETDVLDTWFSSGLWPMCTLGWPDKTANFEYFYPTQTIVMGYEIIFFWAIRMIFQGLENTGKSPFENLLIHGIVRDDKGRKMSKSLGNGIDPVSIVNEFGADVLRFSLISGTKLDRDPRYSIEKATLARNFINKIWNAVKFFELQMKNEKLIIKNSLSDKWILTKLNAIIKSTTRKYEKFDFGVAANDLQGFFWNDVCDVYIEFCKSRVEEGLRGSAQTLGFVMQTFLKLIAPIMPFVTEQIFCEELGLGETLTFEKFPLEDKSMNFHAAKKEFDKIIEQQKEQRVSAERANGLDKKIEQLRKEIEKSEKLLANKGFVANAPKEVVAAEHESLRKNREALKKLSI